MTYLLDTDVLSAAAPPKAQARAEWNDWLFGASDRLYLSTITLAEIEQGIAAAIGTGATTKAEKLRLWLATVEQLYGERLLPFDGNVARRAGAMLDKARGHAMGFADIAIAATAAAHGLTLLTANERHFRPLDIASLNPFTRLPPL
ncbi:putative nucleic acid-binding protein [Bosea sp. BE125]|uniref:PIN domain-containing protein n=1 Tax=Bosea sp. BE125 TaxID=2817909 RepID=UPI0028577E40|nr:PIN domain-containing protein [Bosea sp. BE125]MDR6873237.1 putative nucleic acid-binding protein [Bosea sp. BE125]